MKKNDKSKGLATEPTKSEVEILQVLWRLGPSSARMVNDQINSEIRPVIYMSTLKLMQIMIQKGLLEKDESRMTHIYRAAVDESRTKGLLLDKMVRNVFDGSPGRLMMQLLDDQKMSPEEMEEFKQLIMKIDQKK